MGFFVFSPLSELGWLNWDFSSFSSLIFILTHVFHPVLLFLCVVPLADLRALILDFLMISYVV